MKLDHATRTLTLEATDCRQCKYGTPGTGPTPVACPTCKGTGKGPRGKARGCRNCYGSGRAWDHETRQPCSSCGGNYIGADREDFCDSAPVDAVLSLPLSIVRIGRANTWNENYLGIGTLWSCTDYGRTAESDDDAILADIRGKLATDRTQATKIVHPYERDAQTATLVDSLVIVVTRNGYSVRPYTTTTS